MNSYELVKDGSPKAIIVIGDDSSKTEALAARQIVNHFKRFAGAELPVRKCSEVEMDSVENFILLGTPESNPLLGDILRSGSPLKEGELGAEGYLIRMIPGSPGGNKYLLIAGQKEIGTLYGAVYFIDFLSEIEGTSATAPGDLDVRRRPALQMRGMYTIAVRMPYYDLTAWKRIIDDMAESAMNALYFWFAGAFRSRKFPETIIREHGDHKYTQNGAEFHGTVMSDEDIRELIDYAHERGVKFYLGSGVFGWDGVQQYIPTNNALTNKAQWDFMRDYLAEMMDVYPEADGLFLEIADEYAEWELPIEEAGRLELKFLKELAEAVWKSHPEAKLIWAIGYPNHSENPSYYEELKTITDPRIIFFMARLGSWYVSSSGERMSFSDPDALRDISKSQCLWDHFMHHSIEGIQNTAQLAEKAEVLGYTPAREFQLAYIPSGDPHLYGWYSLAAPATDDFPTDYLPMKLNALIFRELCWDPYISVESIKDKLRKKFLGAETPEELADGLILVRDIYSLIYYNKLGGETVEFRKAVGGVETVEKWRRTGEVPQKNAEIFKDIEEAKRLYLSRLKELERKIDEYLPSSSKKSKDTLLRMKKTIGDYKQNVLFCP